MEQCKQRLSIVILGSQRSGKSSVTGHLLCHCNGIYKTKAEYLEREAEKSGKGSFKYAWVLEKLAEERQHGNLRFSLWNFETAKYNVNIFDAHGYKDALSETATAITQVDCAVLVVSASIGEYEVSTSKNGLTYVHAMFAFTLGVKQLIVCVNKMDLVMPSYSEERFKHISDDLSRHLNAIGFDMTSVVFIPTSSYGDNLVTLSTNTPWFTSRTLLESIDSCVPIDISNRVERVPLDNSDSTISTIVDELFECRNDEMIVLLVDLVIDAVDSIYRNIDIETMHRIVKSIVDKVDERLVSFNARVLSVVSRVSGNETSGQRSISDDDSGVYRSNGPSAPPYTFSNDEHIRDPPPPYELVGVSKESSTNYGGQELKSRDPWVGQNGGNVVTTQPLPKCVPITDPVPVSIPIIVPIPMPIEGTPAVPCTAPSTDNTCCLCGDICPDDSSCSWCWLFNCCPFDFCHGCDDCLDCIKCCEICCDNLNCDCACDL